MGFPRYDRSVIRLPRADPHSHLLKYSQDEGKDKYPPSPACRLASSVETKMFACDHLSGYLTGGLQLHKVRMAIALHKPLESFIFTNLVRHSRQDVKVNTADRSKVVLNSLSDDAHCATSGTDLAVSTRIWIRWLVDMKWVGSDTHTE